MSRTCEKVRSLSFLSPVLVIPENSVILNTWAVFGHVRRRPNVSPYTSSKRHFCRFIALAYSDSDTGSMAGRVESTVTVAAKQWLTLPGKKKRQQSRQFGTLLTKGIAILGVNMISRLNVTSQADCLIVRLLNILQNQLTVSTDRCIS